MNVHIMRGLVCSPLAHKIERRQMVRFHVHLLQLLSRDPPHIEHRRPLEQVVFGSPGSASFPLKEKHLALLRSCLLLSLQCPQSLSLPQMSFEKLRTELSCPLSIPACLFRFSKLQKTETPIAQAHACRTVRPLDSCASSPSLSVYSLFPRLLARQRFVVRFRFLSHILPGVTLRASDLNAFLHWTSREELRHTAHHSRVHLVINLFPTKLFRFMFIPPV
mmetsp:Transcript_14931/g.30163  ORF Transcript_14931/g.30163 Transcript_14931/m.30163 type:complete len:220 (+) Transcript_14931:539-1198(+)